MKMFSFQTLTAVLRPKRILNRSRFTFVRRLTIDSRTVKQQDAFIAIRGKWKDGHDFIDQAQRRGAGLIIAESPAAGMKPAACTFIVDDSHKALEKIGRYIRDEKAPRTIAVTGSVGKTTTKEMIAYLLARRQKVLKNEKTENNFLGVSKTILRLTNEPYLLLEAGTNAPGEIARLTKIMRPDIAVITFIKPVHTEGLGSLEAIYREKQTILTTYRRTRGVINYDDYRLRRLKKTKRVITFGMKKGADIRARIIRSDGRESVFRVDGVHFRLRTPFYFYIYNALAALVTAQVTGMAMQETAAMMDEFVFDFSLRTRREKKRKLTFINDTYNSNPFALECVVRSLSCYRDPKIALVGDMRELGTRSKAYHRRLAGDFLRQKFDYVLTLGEDSRALSEKLKESGYRKAFHFSSREDIVAFLKKKIPEKKYMVLVKGSRSMEMEKIIEQY